MQKMAKFFVVALTLVATSAPCFCWVQMVDMPGCHAATEMEDCCCSTDAAVEQEMPVRDLAVLPVEWQNPQLDQAFLSTSEFSFTTDRSFLPVKARDRGGPLRSPPEQPSARRLLRQNSHRQNHLCPHL